MDFSAEGGDVWDSTPSQDLFIQRYFATKEYSNKVVSKRERKRKKKQASNVASTSIQSDNKFELNNSNKKASLIDHNTFKRDNYNKKKPNICKTPQNIIVSSISKDGKNKKNDIQSKQLEKKRKLNTNKVSQTLNAESKITTSVQNFTITPESKKSDDELPLRKFKSRNKRKFKTKNVSETEKSSESEHEDLPKDIPKPKKKEDEQIKNKSLLKSKANVKTKKLKASENISNAKESMHNNNNKPPLNEAKAHKLKGAKNISDAKESLNNDSENSEEDNNIRNELQNSRVFLKIQKLMKMDPHLNPSYCDDSEASVELSLCDKYEISSEYSSSQADDECSESDDDEALRNDEVVESVEVSEDSSHNDEEDSSDGEESSDSYEKNTKSPESNHVTGKEVVQTPDIEIPSPTSKKPATFIEKARSKLAAAKFRFLNEKLYTESGREAYQYFQENREEFEDYHLGYRQQVSKWPLNPVDEIIKDLQKLKKDAVIADLGCGEAKIARVLSNRNVHSFDLVAKHECVTACDFSKVPLKDSSVDVAVFCLSLMGVNLVDYLREAYRILKIGGILKIAEVESRVENLDIFIENLKTLGFVVERQNLKNKLFVFLDLKKVKKKKTSKGATITLRPCMYKKR